MASAALINPHHHFQVKDTHIDGITTMQPEGVEKQESGNDKEGDVGEGGNSPDNENGSGGDRGGFGGGGGGAGGGMWYNLSTSISLISIHRILRSGTRKRAVEW